MNRISTATITLIFIGAVILSHSSFAQDFKQEKYWNQFRGPNGDGKAIATNLPIEFNETKNVRWKTPIHDKGYSSPVIWVIKFG